MTPREEGGHGQAFCDSLGAKSLLCRPKFYRRMRRRHAALEVIRGFRRNLGQARQDAGGRTELAGAHVAVSLPDQRRHEVGLGGEGGQPGTLGFRVAARVPVQQRRADFECATAEFFGPPRGM